MPTPDTRVSYMCLSKDCAICLGAGEVTMPPHSFDEIVTGRETDRCANCNGQGKKFVFIPLDEYASMTHMDEAAFHNLQHYMSTE